MKIRILSCAEQEFAETVDYYNERCITNRFPYGVLYQVRQEFILVSAIMHLKRDPKKWQERIKKTLS